MLAHNKKCNWRYIHANPAWIDEIRASKHKHWDAVSENPAAIDILEQNQQKIDWKAFSTNPAIFISTQPIRDLLTK